MRIQIYLESEERKHMSIKHLLGVLSVSILLAAIIASCNGESSPTPQIAHSPLASQVETPAMVQESTPSSKCASGCIEPSEDCLIKGVVTAMGEKHYYLPDTEGYQETQLLVKYGGRWFCTEEEAIKSGFQKAPE